MLEGLTWDMLLSLMKEPCSIPTGTCVVPGRTLSWLPDWRRTRAWSCKGRCNPSPAPASQNARVLARAIKEWVRREGDKQGFSDAPADCLAFKFYRDVSSTALRAAAGGCDVRG